MRFGRYSSNDSCCLFYAETHGANVVPLGLSSLRSSATSAVKKSVQKELTAEVAEIAEKFRK